MTSTAVAVQTGGKVVFITGMFGAPEREIFLAREMTITEAISAHHINFRLPTIAVLNGEPVLRGQWAVRNIRESDVIAFAVVPGGGSGGGSNNGKQVLGLVAALALSVAAPFIGSFLATTFFGGSAIAASLASAAFIAGGPLSTNILEPSDLDHRHSPKQAHFRPDRWCRLQI